jgi:hypothetical protein
MSEQGVVVMRKGIVGTCAFVAVVLLVVFYSTVSGAVERATRHRVAGAEAAPVVARGASPRSPAPGRAVVARIDR